MTTQQIALLSDYLARFLARPYITNDGVEEQFEVFDQKRIDAIPILKALIDSFIVAKINLQEFKEQHEIKCREYPYWGFKGFSGQMQLNQFANNISDENKEELFRKSLRLPSNESDARKVIDSLADFITQKRAATDNPRPLPRAASVSYMLSYFWEIQDHTTWPTHYKASKTVLQEAGFNITGHESVGASYVEFRTLINQIQLLYATKVPSLKFPYWFVEHVLWNQYLAASTAGPPIVLKPKGANLDRSKRTDRHASVTNEWLPPIISDLNDLAFNKPTEWSNRNAVKPEKAFETKVRIAFTLLGFEATELGQGTGRQPDGIAISMSVPDGDYAIVYDAKAREKSFSVGTSDREMYEYIRKKSEELRKQRVTRQYFVIISSDFDNRETSLSLIKDVFRKTRIPITMLKASDLLFLVEEKLKDIEITHDRIESLFLETGLLPRDKMIDILGIR